MSNIHNFEVNKTIKLDSSIEEQLALKRYVSRMIPRENTLFKLRTHNPLEIDSPNRVAARKAMINPKDLYSLEAIVGNNDMFPIHYLEKGLIAAKSVCRIIINDHNGRLLGFGTGFMVSPTLLITNNHVLPNLEISVNSIAQFNYEQDLNFIERKTEKFKLRPDTFFMTDVELDFTLIAIEEISLSSVNINDFGYLPLIKQTGKALLGEYVSIIQHPNGWYKSIVLRENEIIDMFDHFIHYTADTNEGSSGSVVCNDSWEVVALHHAGIKDPQNPGNYIANEGIRISSILQYIEQNKYLLNDKQQKLIENLGKDIDVQLNQTTDGITNTNNEEDIVAEDFSLDRYIDLNGHDINFLGENHKIPLPKIRADLEKDIAETVSGEKILNYTHFSIMISKSRRLAFYTVVDIDGKQLKEEKRSKWRYDPRIDRKYQCGNELYKNNKVDRGHLVRRRDPVWGEDSFNANEDTFHYTNCAPQHEKFNQSTNLWLGLEDYLLNIFEGTHKAVVFTGPVFRENDIKFRDVKIPEEYWKVAVVMKSDTELSATAYIVSQKEYLNDLEIAIPGEFKTFQIKISIIEALTGLDFNNLRNYDPLERFESTTYGTLIKNFNDIIF
ncbi:DNA/RNA non-specific endonuclease [Lacrimispora sp. 38-1]|uniref:DNA/RNA non-specific endonuclease n=1 Tax=Lacrimispora sp. 38-1 TaxID=3125778 RepID=UPI003CE92142